MSCRVVWGYAAVAVLQREFCRDLFYAANTTYNERAERLTLEEEIKINEVKSNK